MEKLLPQLFTQGYLCLEKIAFFQINETSW